MASHVHFWNLRFPSAPLLLILHGAKTRCEESSVASASYPVFDIRGELAAVGRQLQLPSCRVPTDCAVGQGFQTLESGII